MRLEQLRYFKAVIERESFNGASRSLNISQPAITTAIKQLEEEIGAPLLIRSATRNVRPTQFGYTVYKDICEFLSHFETMVNSWQPTNAHAPLTGQVRLLAYPTIAVWLVEYVLPVLHKAQPGLEVVVEETANGSIEKNLKAKMCHIALFAQLSLDESREVQALRNGGYLCDALAEDEFVICLGARHPLAARASLTPEDWQGLTLCTTPSYGEAWPPEAHPVLGTRAEKSIYFGSRETLLHNLETEHSAAIFLEKMMTRHWKVLEGRLVTRKIAGLSLYPCHYVLAALPAEALSAQEIWLVGWLKENFTDFSKLA